MRVIGSKVRAVRIAAIVCGKSTRRLGVRNTAQRKTEDRLHFNKAYFIIPKS